ncbi:diguanylate cyclase [Mariprofundus ferrooxydans]|uniref:diguanylate cyclase n=1 Tax=Mariprofundus ferrooxydans TaxID=314344 RepID=UPI00036C8EFD|nr:diguanylate cyclase [Mariprofundus ferrooxydans]
MSEPQVELAHLSKWMIFVILLWTAIVIASLYWNVAVEKEHTLREAVTEARANFDKNKTFRLWAASHGGVYVPVNKDNQPNPGMASMPERDLTTLSGMRLTLMNPSAIIRQMKSGGTGRYAVKEKLTTFEDKLLDPKNKPDSWEAKSLKALKQGAAEVKEITQIDGVTYMRLMQPLFIEQGCLKCHGNQGYQVGDFSGGLDVAVPMATYLKHVSDVTVLLWKSYGLIWLVGLSGIVYAFRHNRAIVSERLKLISELQEMNDKLERYSYQDGLTRVANRRMFDTLLDREWAAARRGGGRQLALVMIDIDYFKLYNDTYGHLAGDDCLKRIAAALSRVSKRTTDLIARYGGEEFVLLLPNTGREQAHSLAEQCLRDIAALQIPHSQSEAAEVVTISVGVTTMAPDATMQAAMLIEMADRALYRAKESGRNRVEVA